MRFRFSFNPIKVLFLQAHLWGTRVASYPLSILSRFYFYTKAKQENKIPMLTFNPIKVLFLLIVTLKEPYAVIPFNPIKVLFLPVILLVTRGVVLSFNPIKVLFLRKTWRTKPGLSASFQSYQGSIFTHRMQKLSPVLDIFQSYQGSIFTIYKPFHQIFPVILSILSRFYFYFTFSLSFSRCFSFQSYQGSIFTYTTLLYYVMVSSFNPIKVLFLHLTLTEFSRRS